jgi:hypothetical protein
MQLSLKEKLLIEKIAVKISNIDIEPYDFFENFVQFRLTKILNEQETLTNWYQNVANYFKGGYGNFLKRQVDINSKFVDAINSLESIVRVIKNFPNIDPQYSEDLLDHMNDIVDSMKSSQPAVKTIGDKIMLTHEQPKMTGQNKTWHSSEQVDKNVIRSMPISLTIDQLIQNSIPWFTGLDQNNKKYISDMASFAAKSVMPNIRKMIAGLPTATFSPLTAMTPFVKDEQHAKNIISSIVNNYYKFKLKPLESLTLTSGGLNNPVNYATIKDWMMSNPNEINTLMNELSSVAFPSTFNFIIGKARSIWDGDPSATPPIPGMSNPDKAKFGNDLRNFAHMIYYVFQLRNLLKQLGF